MLFLYKLQSKSHTDQHALLDGGHKLEFTCKNTPGVLRLSLENTSCTYVLNAGDVRMDFY